MNDRIRSSRGFRRLVLGFVIGFVAGSATLSIASFGRKGWERFGFMFKQGYVAGFIDCVHIAQAIDPFSYVATQYPAPLRAKPLEWVEAVDRLYAQDVHKDRPMSQLLMIAGTQLQAKYPEKIENDGARLEALKHAIERGRAAELKYKKQMEAEAAAKAKGEGDAAKSGDAAEDGGAKSDDKAAGGSDDKKDAGAAAKDGASQGDVPKNDHATNDPDKKEPAADDAAKTDSH
jgi:hypothetical protein